MRKLVDTDKYGSFIGITNISVALAQLCMSLLFTGIETLNSKEIVEDSEHVLTVNNVDNKIFALPLCLLSFGLSVFLMYVEKMPDKNAKSYVFQELKNEFEEEQSGSEENGNESSLHKSAFLDN